MRNACSRAFQSTGRPSRDRGSSGSRRTAGESLSTARPLRLGATREVLDVEVVLVEARSRRAPRPSCSRSSSARLGPYEDRWGTLRARGQQASAPGAPRAEYPRGRRRSVRRRRAKCSPMSAMNRSGMSSRKRTSPRRTSRTSGMGSLAPTRPRGSAVRRVALRSLRTRGARGPGQICAGPQPALEHAGRPASGGG